MIQINYQVVCDGCGRCASWVLMESGLDRMTYKSSSISDSLIEAGWKLKHHSAFRAEHRCPGCVAAEKEKKR